MFEDIKNWLNSTNEGTETPTMGDYLRSVIENMFMAIVELLNALGEWPIDFE